MNATADNAKELKELIAGHGQKLQRLALDVERLSTTVKLAGSALTLIIIVFAAWYGARTSASLAASQQATKQVDQLAQNFSKVSETVGNVSGSFADAKKSAQTAVAVATEAAERSAKMLAGLDSAQQRVFEITSKVEGRLASVEQSVVQVENKFDEAQGNFRQLALKDLQGSLVNNLIAATFSLAEADLLIPDVDTGNSVLAIGTKEYPEAFQEMSDENPALILGISPTEGDPQVAKLLDVSLVFADPSKFSFVVSGPSEDLIRQAEITYIAIAR